MALNQKCCVNILWLLTCFLGSSINALPQYGSLSLASDTFTSEQPSSTSVTQTPTSTVPEATKPGTTGTINTSLDTSGRPSKQPFVTTTIASPSSVASLPSAVATAVSMTKAQSPLAGGIATDAFRPIATGALPSQISSRGDHPTARIGIEPQNNPLSTNKFYANLFLGSQTQGVWTHPYSVSWSHGSGNAKSWGLSVSHIDAEQKAYGPPNTAIPGSPVQYFINPLGIQSIILSATELGSSTVLTTDSLEAFSVNANLQPQAGSASRIKFPLVQGMGFVTGIYTNLQPAVQSSVFFRNVVEARSPRSGVFKYIATLEDTKTWLIYAMPSDGKHPQFNLTSNTLFQGPAQWSGTIQVAKNTAGPGGESAFDHSSGVYAATGDVRGSTSGKRGTYQLRWTKSGLSTGQPLIMFALPHHVQSFTDQTKRGITPIQLATTTKGNAVAVLADSWTMVEPALPVHMGFAPWNPSNGTQTKYSASAVSAILSAASSEVSQDMGAQSNLDSMYFSGKALSKFASIVYTISDIANQPNLAKEGLAQLKTAYARFATNAQIYPLVYDTAWKGVVSSASYTLHDAGADFGNSYYNDHHFHYGYFVHAAAIIAYLDPGWLSQNTDWVNTLVRDIANPSKQDNYFPVSRSFDWYHGHSWAKGLFESGDSKDEESSSEDVMFAYGMKMWGHVIGDSSMEARGNLMLSVLTRSLQNYFLMQSDNTVQPPNFIGNKVSGILFENKIDHTTYFGTNPEYVQGIHMIPLIPASSLVRTKRFVSEEWRTFFCDGCVAPVSQVQGGWRGILMANLALIDPRTSFDFFARKEFDPAWLDGGASRTWYLAFAAGMGGATY